MKRGSSEETEGTLAKQKKIHTVFIAGNNNEQWEDPFTPIELVSLFTLNSYCLRSLLEYLSIVDLFNMCAADSMLKEMVVANGGMKRRVFDFSEISRCCHVLDVFKIFGQQMTNIKISDQDIQYKAPKVSKLDEILRLITKFCAVDSIKHFDLKYHNSTKINKSLVDASIPFFRSIESLKISETEHPGLDDCINYFIGNAAPDPSVEYFVERILENAQNISSIKMRRLRISGRFFQLEHMNELKSLSLIGCHLRETNNFISFVEKNSKLRKFQWENSSLAGLDTATSHSSNCVFKLAARKLLDLETFGYYPNEGFINEQDEYDTNSMFILPDFGLLENFRKLKKLKIHGTTLDVLKLLTRKNSVEKLLTGYTSYTTKNSADLSFLQNFTNLKFIQLFTSGFDKVKELNKNIVSKLPNLTGCHLNFIKICADVIKKVVESSKNLKNLKISFTTGKFEAATYLSLLRIRMQGGVDNPLVIYIEQKLRIELISDLGEEYKPEQIALM